MPRSRAATKRPDTTRATPPERETWHSFQSIGSSPQGGRGRSRRRTLGFLEGRKNRREAPSPRNPALSRMTATAMAAIPTAICSPHIQAQSRFRPPLRPAMSKIRDGFVALSHSRVGSNPAAVTGKSLEIHQRKTGGPNSHAPSMR